MLGVKLNNKPVIIYIKYKKVVQREINLDKKIKANID